MRFRIVIEEEQESSVMVTALCDFYEFRRFHQRFNACLFTDIADQAAVKAGVGAGRRIISIAVSEAVAGQRGHTGIEIFFIGTKGFSAFGMQQVAEQNGRISCPLVGKAVCVVFRQSIFFLYPDAEDT